MGQEAFEGMDESTGQGVRGAWLAPAQAQIRAYRYQPGGLSSLPRKDEGKRLDETTDTLTHFPNATQNTPYVNVCSRLQTKFSLRGSGVVMWMRATVYRFNNLLARSAGLRPAFASSHDES